MEKEELNEQVRNKLAGSFVKLSEGFTHYELKGGKNNCAYSWECCTLRHLGQYCFCADRGRFQGFKIRSFRAWVFRQT